MSTRTNDLASEKLVKHFINFDNYLKKSLKEFELRLRNPIKETGTIDNFIILKSLGTGSFGKVVLTKHKGTNKLHAMKILEKVSVIKNRQLLHTIAEIKLLDCFNFPFIVQLDYFFKNNVYIFLVMQFVAAGEMFYHLRKNKKFDEAQCKFYAAQVILSFEYMHNMGVIYRDLKPENILLDVDGYIKITDLGFCKKIDSQRTYTLCGTPEYLAPEIILSQGYNFSVDWWSLGVLIFEMAAGFPPFYARDHMKLYEKIVAGKYNTPPHFSKKLKDLLYNLIQVERSKRFGMLKGGVRDIKNHEWFKGVDFDQILNKKVKPLFVPAVSSEGDTKYFEGFGDVVFRFSSTNEFEEEFREFNLL